MKLGKDTKWCTAHENPDWYNKYTQDGGKLYIVSSKSSDERWQYSDKTGDFLDKDDEDFDVYALLKTDRKLSKFFSKLLGIDVFYFDGSYVYIGESVPKFVAGMVRSITIPDFVTSIDDYAFRNCARLESITIPDSVTRIGFSAFGNCTSLKNITIPDSVTRIGEYAFAFCYSLTNIKIPDSVTSIGGNAFYKCQNLTVFTNNNYVIDYCREKGIPFEKN